VVGVWNPWRVPVERGGLTVFFAEQAVFYSAS